MTNNPKRSAFLAVGLTLATVSIGYAAWMAFDVLSRSETTEELWNVNPKQTRDIRVIKLDHGAGSIRLVGGSTDGITGTRTVKHGLRKPRYTEQIKGDTLTLKTNCPNSPVCAVDYALSVPEGVRIIGTVDGGKFAASKISGDISISASGGSISLADTSGAVKASSSGGGVRTARSSGPLDLMSSGGSVDATGVAGSTLVADSSGGEVSIVFTKSPDTAEVSSSGGSVNVVVPNDDASYQVDASSSGGDAKVEVRTDPASKKTLDVSSSGGDVRVKYPATNP